jgi:hypothetical protein
MHPVEAAILFLLKHVAAHADGPTSDKARRHLSAVEEAFLLQDHIFTGIDAAEVPEDARFGHDRMGDPDFDLTHDPE